MTEFLCEYIKNVPDSSEAVNSLAEFYAQLPETKKQRIEVLKKQFFASEREFADILDELRRLTEPDNLGYYCLCAVFIMSCYEQTMIIYENNAISMEIFWNTAADIFFKMRECKTVYGVYGTFVASWYADFFKLKRFSFGRLQCECVSFSASDCRVNGNIVKTGQRVLNVHIPSCGHIEREDVIKSLDKAYDFFGFEGVMPVICNSWLLYPDHINVYPEKSRIRKFFDMFQKKIQKKESSRTVGEYSEVKQKKINIKILKRKQLCRKILKNIFLKENEPEADLELCFFKNKLKIQIKIFFDNNSFRIHRP